MILDAARYLLEPTPWSAQAACAGQPTDQWFPRRGQPAVEAHACCARCPVTRQCLDYAVRWNIGQGIWGGLSTRERRLIPRAGRPHRLPPTHGTTTAYTRGCRCDECRAANRTADYWRNHRDAGHLGNLEQLAYLVFLIVFILVGLRFLGLVR